MAIPLTLFRRKAMNETADFLGQEFEIATCPDCEREFEVMQIDDNNDVCPVCSNKHVMEGEA